MNKVIIAIIISGVVAGCCVSTHPIMILIGLIVGGLLSLVVELYTKNVSTCQGPRHSNNKESTCQGPRHSNNKESTCQGSECIREHSQSEENYEWLRDKYGKVLKVEFEEPVGSGDWTTYDDSWWERHCQIISHNPPKLKESHVKAFIDPETRFARLRFTFEKNGMIYQLEASPDMFDLEEWYFQQKYGCTYTEERVRDTKSVRSFLSTSNKLRNLIL